MSSQKNKEDLNFKGRDIKTTLDILWGLRNGDKFYFMSYGEDLIKSLNTQEVKAALKKKLSNRERERLCKIMGRIDALKEVEKLVDSEFEISEKCALKVQELINKLKR